MNFLKRLLLQVELLLSQLVGRVELFLFGLECGSVNLLLRLDSGIEPVVFGFDSGFSGGVDGVDLQLECSIQPFGLGGDPLAFRFLNRSDLGVVLVHDSLLASLDQRYLGLNIPSTTGLHTADVIDDVLTGRVVIGAGQSEDGLRALQLGNLAGE